MPAMFTLFVVGHLKNTFLQIELKYKEETINLLKTKRYLLYIKN